MVKVEYVVNNKTFVATIENSYVWRVNASGGLEVRSSDGQHHGVWAGGMWVRVWDHDFEYEVEEC